MTDDERAAWLRLAETPGIGRDSARRLLAAFGSPEAVFDAGAPALQAVVSARQASALRTEPPALVDCVSRTRAWLAEGEASRAIVTLGDPLYPAALLQTADPPLMLYLQGRIACLTEPNLLAMVGSRNPTAQGRDTARAFARHLSRSGWTIVSGLALGIDAAAHEGALDGPGNTIAVVGTGLDRVYPASHRELAHRIAQDGLIVSEYSLGTPPLAAHFPQRNRIIAGLARGTLVVEAALQSGSLITARMAAEAGREVFAVPGSIHSPQSRGCHALIKQGAKLVETADDLLEELGARLPREPDASTAQDPPRADTEADALLDALGYDPVSLDALSARTGWSTAELSVRLLELELAGRVARLPGQLFQRRSES